MPLEEMRCPNCGGSIEFGPSNGFFTCSYCGSKLMAVRQSQNKTQRKQKKHEKNYIKGLEDLTERLGIDINTFTPEEKANLQTWVDVINEDEESDV